MDVFKVSGNGPLKGEVHVGGAKNAALPILAATLLTDEKVVLRNVPDLSDMRFMLGFCDTSVRIPHKLNLASGK